MSSPIETSLLRAIVTAAPVLGLRVVVSYGWQSFEAPPVAHPSDQLIDAHCEPPIANLTIYPEAVLAGYRADLFCCLTHQGTLTSLIVECDGHDWHERTQQQASYDRARDRDLLRQGLSTIRFTGSEIHRDANQCARETLEVLRGLHALRHRCLIDEAAALVDRAFDSVAAERQARGGG